MWAVELWAQNIFNKNYKQVAFDTPLQGACTQRGAAAGFCAASTGFANRATQLYSAFLGEPRTFGLTLKSKFRAARKVEEVPPPPVVEAPPPPPPPATQTCSDGTVILASDVCPPPPPPPPPPPTPERGG